MRYFGFLIGLVVLLAPGAVAAQENQSAPPGAASSAAPNERPNVKAYLDYLKQELTVTDERSSQREVNPAYIRRNFNRVSALRAFALKIARETDNDYIPEMEAVTQGEFHILFFDQPPPASALQAGEVYAFSYRYLGSVKNAEMFYIFARLDPYEEERVRRKGEKRAETKQAAEAPEKIEKGKMTPSVALPAEETNAPGKKTEKTLTREVFFPAADKKTEVFLKKNP